MKLYNPGQNIGKPITRGHFPKQAQSLYVPLDFSTDTDIKVALPIQAGISNQTGLDGAQSVFVDNSNNSEVVVFTFSNGFVLTAPAYTMGIYPVLVDLNGLFFDAVSTGGVLVRCFFTNTREQPAMYLVQSNFAGTVSVTGSIVYASATRQNLTDRSAAIAVANTPQIIVPANGNRLAFAIRNPATALSQGIAAPEPIYLGFGAGKNPGALGAWELLPGETLMTNQMGICTTQAIYASAATAGHQITAEEA